MLKTFIFKQKALQTRCKIYQITKKKKKKRKVLQSLKQKNYGIQNAKQTAVHRHNIIIRHCYSQINLTTKTVQNPDNIYSKQANKIDISVLTQKDKKLKKAKTPWKIEHLQALQKSSLISQH